MTKFQKKGCDIIKKFYKTTKNLAKKGKNPLNENIPFEKSYMTDFLQGMINYNYEIKAVPIKNGWLELDSMHDYHIYNNKFKDGTISDFFQLMISNFNRMIFHLLLIQVGISDLSL